MNTAASWLRGGIVALVLATPATGEPAEKVALVVSSDLPTLPRVSAALSPALAPAPVLVPAPADDALPAPPAFVDPFPGHTYGNLEDLACVLELDTRNIAYQRYERHARGVQTPVRLLGPLHGVRFQHADTADWLASARREILDCRLVLALDDLAGLLAARGVATVLHYGVYRSDLPLPKRGRPLHHVAALAIDVAAFVKDDGTRLDVQRDWAGRVGARTCEDDLDAPARTARSGELHGILCDVAREKLFHQVLTPNHDARHKDHFHLEVMRETEWTMLE